MFHGMRDAAADLLLGGSCLGCSAPGRLLCRDCSATLPSGARPCWPTPSPPGLAAPWATAEYDGVVRNLVVGHKEHRLLALGDPLGRLLAHAVAAAAPSGPVVLVPVPSRRRSVRARGHDPTHALTLRAAGPLRARGLDVVVLRMLVPRAGILDQAGLDAGERAANLAGSLWCPVAALRRLRGVRLRASVVVCDDVITTGSTAREAQRALESVGLPVAAIAAVAATRRRLPEGHPARHSDSSALRLSSGGPTH